MIKKTYCKELILAEAIELSNVAGLKKLTMRELAKRLNFSVMPIYDSFTSKEVLIEEIYNEIIREQTRSQGYF